jgi:pimeloyl-ACP methyl ester carboxylesterase
MRLTLKIVLSFVVGLSSAVVAGTKAGISPELTRSFIATGLIWDAVAPNAVAAQGIAMSPDVQFEPIGLAPVHSYVRGKIPVVLIHGLGSNPRSWVPMIASLEADPVIERHFQFWTFGYSTGEPILYSASLLRQSLRQARERYDPQMTDGSFVQTVLIGHSLGGILAKLMAQDSGTALWGRISSQPVDKLLGPADARDALRQSQFFKAVPEVSRIVYIATPHRGSDADYGALRWLGTWLNQPLDDMRKNYEALLASNQPDFFQKSFLGGLPSSVDQLIWEHPQLMALFDLDFKPGVKFHSIVADVDDPPGPSGTDGVVPYASAHLDGASSELIVHGGHLCQGNPIVIRECARILKEHLASTANRTRVADAKSAHNGVEVLMDRSPEPVHRPAGGRVLDQATRPQAVAVAT